MQQERYTEEQLTLVQVLFENLSSERRAFMCELCRMYGLQLEFSFAEVSWIYIEV